MEKNGWYVLKNDSVEPTAYIVALFHNGNCMGVSIKSWESPDKAKQAMSFIKVAISEGNVRAYPAPGGEGYKIQVFSPFRKQATIFEMVSVIAEEKVKSAEQYLKQQAK